MRSRDRGGSRRRCHPRTDRRWSPRGAGGSQEPRRVVAIRIPRPRPVVDAPRRAQVRRPARVREGRSGADPSVSQLVPELGAVGEKLEMLLDGANLRRGPAARLRSHVEVLLDGDEPNGIGQHGGGPGGPVKASAARPKADPQGAAPEAADLTARGRAPQARSSCTIPGGARSRRGGRAGQEARRRAPRESAVRHLRLPTAPRSGTDGRVGPQARSAASPGAEPSGRVRARRQARMRDRERLRLGG
jgi:hypothetical protein